MSFQLYKKSFRLIIFDTVDTVGKEQDSIFRDNTIQSEID